MPPIDEYSRWYERATDNMEKIEPLRKYVFICEGSNTESHYFREFVDPCVELGVDSRVEVALWEKTEGDRGISNPLALARFAQKEKENKDRRFEKGLDKMVIVIDLDVYSRVGEGRTGAKERAGKFEDVEKAITDDDILAVTNPSFELFLLLHAQDAYKRLIQPHAQELLENRKVRHRRPAERLFSEEFKMNPKSNPEVGKLVHRVDTAIEQEGYLNQSVEMGLRALTSNVGSVIDMIRNDRLAL